MVRSLLLLAVLMTAGVVAIDRFTGLFDMRPGGARPIVPEALVTATANRRDADDREILIRAGPDGHFRLEAEVNGETVVFLVDTGATVVALSPADAERLGFDDSTLEYSGRVRTANGVAPVAPLTLDDISIGPLTVRDVPAVVIRRPMTTALLGMSFLSRLEGYEARDDHLVLRW